jgi:2-oxoglutarate ferredoxin oxidoreductase subunit delta
MPLQDIRVQRMIEINEELCKGCDICIDFCPMEVLSISDFINRRGYYTPVVVSEEKCIGCRLCELVCPEFAITVCNE